MKGSHAIAAAGAILIVAAVTYAEAVLDWRTSRADLIQSHALGVNVSMSLAPYNKLVAETREKYGERAEASLDFQTGRITVELDGKIILDIPQEKSLSDVVGLIAVGRQMPLETRFPFRISPSQDVNRLDRKLAEGIRNRFGKASTDARLLAFEDADWTIDGCKALPRGLGLGRVGGWLHMGAGTACRVNWHGPLPNSMLITVASADGDPWMRPFVRRLCREITQAALEQVDPGRRDAPNLAACILADRPRKSSANEALSAEFYSVGLYHVLRRID